MPTQQEEMRDRFRKIGVGSVRFIATRDEVLDFLESEISLAVAQKEKEIVEMIDNEDLECFEQTFIKKDIINLITKQNDKPNN